MCVDVDVDAVQLGIGSRFYEQPETKYTHNHK